MNLKPLPVVEGDYHLQDYDRLINEFSWEDVEKEFTWHETGKMNIAYEAVDRHADSHRKNKVALFYKDENRRETFTYYQMKQMTDKAANVFCSHSTLAKGDRLFVFMPRSPELYFSILGALKLGIVVAPLFESFMESAIVERLLDGEAKAIVTTPELFERIPLDRLPQLETVFLVGDGITETNRQVDFLKQMKTVSSKVQIEWMNREDPTVLHYTSGSSNKPKGILLVQEAMIQQMKTTEWVLDLKEQDIFWCTADPGWVTGTVYGIFGPMLVGATSFVLGDRFSAENWYGAIEEYGVTVWYSAPTAFRMLMSSGNHLLKEYDLSSLRHILSIGEPLNPEIIRWGSESFDLRIHDTWWMTETGALLISNYASSPIKPGSMGKPIPGIEAAIIDHNGNIQPPLVMGNLAIKKGWPAMMRAVWNQDEVYDSYFMNDEWYLSGDSAYVDEDGYFWFQGRVDDVIMTNGERLSPFEVESKLLEHPAVAEAGVIGKPDPVQGEIIKAYIALHEGIEPTDELKIDIQQFVRKGLATHAAPSEIEFKDKLPKTRSGKIIRGVLKSWVMENSLR